MPRLSNQTNQIMGTLTGTSEIQFLSPDTSHPHSNSVMVKTHQSKNAQAMETVLPPPVPAMAAPVRTKWPCANSGLENTVNQPAKQAPRASKKTVCTMLSIFFQVVV